MKKRIFLSLVVVAVVSLFAFLNSNNDVSANSTTGKLDNAGCVYTVNLSGPGSTLTNASVRLREQSTSNDYYASYSSSGVYTVSCPPPGSYDVFVCTNNPSYGATYNVVVGKSGGSCSVSLSSGLCPFGD